jgi:hypothetical protein
MNKVLYASLIVLLVFSGCKKPKPPVDPPVTVDPPPTMNYIKFTLNGPGISNKTYTYSKAKHFLQTYTYSETTAGVINASIDMASASTFDDTLVQVHFDSKLTGTQPFSGLAVFFKFVNIKTGFQSSSVDGSGSFQVSSFTPTQIMVNGSSGLKTGKFAINATFAGELEDDNTGDKWTITGGELKFDGN